MVPVVVEYSVDVGCGGIGVYHGGEYDLVFT